MKFFFFCFSEYFYFIKVEIVLFIWDLLGCKFLVFWFFFCLEVEIFLSGINLSFLLKLLLWCFVGFFEVNNGVLLKELYFVLDWIIIEDFVMGIGLGWSDCVVCICFIVFFFVLGMGLYIVVKLGIFFEVSYFLKVSWFLCLFLVSWMRFSFCIFFLSCLVFCFFWSFFFKYCCLFKYYCWLVRMCVYFLWFYIWVNDMGVWLFLLIVLMVVLYLINFCRYLICFLFVVWCIGVIFEFVGLRKMKWLYIWFFI